MSKVDFLKPPIFPINIIPSKQIFQTLKLWVRTVLSFFFIGLPPAQSLAENIHFHYFYRSETTGLPVYLSGKLFNADWLVQKVPSFHSQRSQLNPNEWLLVVKHSHDQRALFQSAGLKLYPKGFLPDWVACHLLWPSNIKFQENLKEPYELYRLSATINPDCSQIQSNSGKTTPFVPSNNDDFEFYPDGLLLVEVPPLKQAGQKSDSGSFGLQDISGSGDLRELLPGFYDDDSGPKFDFKPGGGWSNPMDINLMVSLLPTTRGKREGDQPVLVGNQEGVLIEVIDSQGHQWQRFYTMDEARELLEGVEDGDELLYRLQGGSLVVKAGKVEDLSSVCRESMRKIVQLAEVGERVQSDFENHHHPHEVAIPPGIISFNGGDKDKKSGGGSGQQPGNGSGSSAQTSGASTTGTTSASNTSGGSGDERDDDEKLGKKIKSQCQASEVIGSSFSKDLLASLENSRRDAGGAEQQMAALEDKYHAYMKASYSSQFRASRASYTKKKQLEKKLKQLKSGSDNDVRLTKCERSRCAKLQRELDALTHGDRLDLSDKGLQNILTSCCKPELARLIPDDMLDLLKSWLGSSYSILEPSRRELIKVLSNPWELRKILQNNPHLAGGDLYIMDDVVFESGSRLSASDPHIDWELREELKLPQASRDYSGMSFKRVTFPAMRLEANFRNCDMSYADFTESKLFCSDFYGADLTAACLSKCTITWCDFHKATLIGVDFSGIEYLTFLRHEQFSKTIELLSQALAEYSRRKSGDQAALTMRARARMLLENKRLEEAEAAYDELMQRNSMEVIDFWQLGHSYLESADRLNDKDKERKAHLAEKAVGCFREGWKVTSNIREGHWNHNVLFDWAIVALGKTGPAFDWRSVLEDIKSTGTKDTRILVRMAQTLADKQEDLEAIDILLRLISTPEYYQNHKGLLDDICKMAAEIGERQPELLNSALIILEGATTFSQEAYNVDAELDWEQQQDLFACWLYRLNLLVKAHLAEEASKVAVDMDKAIPGSLELFSANDYEKTAVWDKGAFYYDELIKTIRTAGVVCSADDDLACAFGGLNVRQIKSDSIAKLLESRLPALTPNP